MRTTLNRYDPYLSGCTRHTLANTILSLRLQKLELM